MSSPPERSLNITPVQFLEVREDRREDCADDMNLLALFNRAAPLPEAPDSKLPPPEQALIFATIAALLAGLILLQQRAPLGASAGHWLPRDDDTGKRTYEVWVLAYSVVWMGSFGVIIAFQLYEAFDATAYFVVCGGLALPLWVQVCTPAPMCIFIHI